MRKPSWIQRLRLAVSGRFGSKPAASLDPVESRISELCTTLDVQFARHSRVYVMVLERLAQCLQERGDLTQARPLLVRAARIAEISLEEDAVTAAQRLSNLAGVLEGMGAYEEAWPVLHRLVALCLVHLGSEHPTTTEQQRRLQRVAWLAVTRGHA